MTASDAPLRLSALFLLIYWVAFASRTALHSQMHSSPEQAVRDVFQAFILAATGFRTTGGIGRGATQLFAEAGVIEKEVHHEGRTLFHRDGAHSFADVL